MQVSPLTGELIPVSKMAEHMRIGLLDPRWREQKERCVLSLSGIPFERFFFLASALFLSLSLSFFSLSSTAFMPYHPVDSKQSWRKARIFARQESSRPCPTSKILLLTARTFLDRL